MSRKLSYGQNSLLSGETRPNFLQPTAARLQSKSPRRSVAGCRGDRAAASTAVLSLSCLHGYAGIALGARAEVPRQKPAEDDDSDSEELINTEPELGSQVEDMSCSVLCSAFDVGPGSQVRPQHGERLPRGLARS